MEIASIRRILYLLACVLPCDFARHSCDQKDNKEWIRNHAFDDVIINVAVIKTVPRVSSILSCIVSCVDSSSCVSFSYNADGRCRLHSLRFYSKNSSSSSYTTSVGWSHYYLSTGACPIERGFVLLDAVKLCFKVFESKVTLTTARATCSQAGSRLIVLDTVEKNKYMFDYLATYVTNKIQYLIGLTDENKEGTFVWENGKVLSYNTWNEDEPSNTGGDEDCTELSDIMYKWNDIGCNYGKSFICEIEMI